MTHRTVHEWGRVAVGDDGFTRGQADALLAAARAHPFGGTDGTDILCDHHRHLRARQMVGVIAARGSSLEILPKVDPTTPDDAPATVRGRLMHMLNVALGLNISTGDASAMSHRADSLLDLFITLFADRLLAEVRHGFKSYLTYAHGGATYDPGTGGETDSDFEIFVADALRGAGYEVIYQVGVEGFRIDLGVRHESCPIGFIAGIECDGAPYHSGLSVRDRDHIRQTILENLGWNIYRVWSTDWFADPTRETAKLIAWVDRVREQISSTLTEQAAPVEVRRPKQKEILTPAVPDQTDDLVSTTSITDPVSESIEVVAEIAGPREPRGRMLRSIGDFDTYEAIRGRLYEIWRDQELLGEVEVVKRATAAPRLFGDRAMAAQSEYEGRVEATGDSFRSFDLYAAMREVASRAMASD